MLLQYGVPDPKVMNLLMSSWNSKTNPAFSSLSPQDPLFLISNRQFTTLHFRMLKSCTLKTTESSWQTWFLYMGNVLLLLHVDGLFCTSWPFVQGVTMISTSKEGITSLLATTTLRWGLFFYSCCFEKIKGREKNASLNNFYISTAHQQSWLLNIAEWNV